MSIAGIRAMVRRFKENGSFWKTRPQSPGSPPGTVPLARDALRRHGLSRQCPRFAGDHWDTGTAVDRLRQDAVAAHEVCQAGLSPLRGGCRAGNLLAGCVGIGRRVRKRFAAGQQPFQIQFPKQQFDFVDRGGRRRNGARGGRWWGRGRWGLGHRPTLSERSPPPELGPTSITGFVSIACSFCFGQNSFDRGMAAGGAGRAVGQMGQAPAGGGVLAGFSSSWL